MKIKNKKSLSTSTILTLGALFVLPVVGNAATLVSYPFTTAAPWNSNVTPVEGTSVTPASVGVVATENGIIGRSGSSDIYYQITLQSLANEQGVIDANFYTEFTITPDAGLAVSYDSFSLNYGGTRITNNEHKANYFVRTSLDGYSANIATFSYVVPQSGGAASEPDHSQFYSLDLSLLGDFQNVDEALTFRIYAYSDEFAGNYSSTGRPRVTNIKVEGTVAVIPESSTAIFIALAALGLTAVFHRRGCARRRTV